MDTNKRQRTDDQDQGQGRHVSTHTSPAAAPSAARTPKLKLCAELATKPGTRYCREEELLVLVLMLSKKMWSPVLTFEVMAAQISTATGSRSRWRMVTGRQPM
jgi:hypothetical protein